MRVAAHARTHTRAHACALTLFQMDMLNRPVRLAVSSNAFRFRSRYSASSSGSVMICLGALNLLSSSCSSLLSRRMCSTVIWRLEGARFLTCCALLVVEVVAWCCGGGGGGACGG